MVTPTIADDRNLGYTLAAADYLPKPIDRERLTAVLAGNRCDRPALVLVVSADSASSCGARSSAMGSP